MRGAGHPRPAQLGIRGTGAFAGRVEPQQLDLAASGALVDTLLGDNGAAGFMGRQRFTAGDLTPQTFLAPPSHPNDPASGLEPAGRVGVGNYRRMLNRSRGHVTAQ